MAENFEDRAEKAAGAAGTLAGGASGAELIGPFIRIPFVGPVVGAVVGGIAGNEIGRRLGRATVSGGTAFFKTLTSS